MPIEDFCIEDSEGEDNGGHVGQFDQESHQTSERNRNFDELQFSKAAGSTIQSFTRPATNYSTSISSFTAAIVQDTSINVETSQISSSSSRDHRPVKAPPQQPLVLTATTKPRRPKPRPRVIEASPPPQQGGVEEEADKSRRPKPKAKRLPVILSSSPLRPEPSNASGKSHELPPSSNQEPEPFMTNAAEASATKENRSSIPRASPADGMETGSPGPSNPRKRKRRAVIDFSDDEGEFAPGPSSSKGTEKENTHPSTTTALVESTTKQKKKSRKKQPSANKGTCPVVDPADDADELNLRKTSSDGNKKKAQKKASKRKKAKDISIVADIEANDNVPKTNTSESRANESTGLQNLGDSEAPLHNKPTETSTSKSATTAPTPPLPVQELNHETTPAKAKSLSAKTEDPLKAFRIPVRSRVSMTELLNRMGCRSPAGSPAALKNSKRAVGKIAPLHSTRRTPPPPPPRVARVEKKTKAQRDEEALWDEEWEEQLGEAWFEMSEEDKERMRRGRRNLLWVED